MKSNVKRWTEDEDNFLKNNVGMSLTELSNKLNRTRNSVKTRKTTLCLYGSRGQKWTDEEIKFIEQNKNLKSAGEIGKVLNKTTTSVYRKINKMKNSIKTSQVKFWTNDEIEFLRKHHLHKTLMELSKLLTDRSELQIREKMSRLGISAIDIKSPQKWSKEDDEFLKNNTHMSLAELSQKLQRTKYAVKDRKNKFGLNLKNNIEMWTKDEITFLKKNNSKLNHKEIAEQLSRTESAILHKINKLGIYSERAHVSDDIKWTSVEYMLLIKHKNKTITELMIIFPNRSRASIYSKKHEIGATKCRKWTEQEILIIYENQDKTDKQIAKLTKRSESSVVIKRQRLGLLKKENKMWTRDEVKFLTKNYSMNSDKLADILGISKKRLREKLTRMGLIETGEPGRPWTKEERIKLKEKHKTTNSIKNISELFQDRTFYSVCGEVRKLPIQPKEKYKMENGYIKILINNKYVFQHRRVMQPLDKTLTKFDIIHHLDYDKTNNSIKNLVVLTNSQHRTVHGTANKLISPLMEAGYIQYDFTNQVYKTSKSILTFEARKKIAISFKTNIYYIPTNKQRDVVGMLPKTNLKHTSSKKPWTPEEIRIITDTSNATYLKLCILLPDRTYKAITNKASRLGIVIRNNIKSFGFISGRGYRVLWVNGEKLLEHRGVMALKLGRMLEDHEIVHHVDHIKYNNKIWNLDLFENHSKHKIAEYSFNKCMPELFKRKIVSYSKKTRSYKLGKNF